MGPYFQQVMTDLFGGVCPADSWSWEWHRGFVDELTMSCEDWLQLGKHCVQTVPLMVVVLDDRQPAEAKGRFTWTKTDRHWAFHKESEVPDCLFVRLAARRRGKAQYASAEEAAADLNRAALAWAWAQAWDE
jgi:hypothetical protein